MPPSINGMYFTANSGSSTRRVKSKNARIFAKLATEIITARLKETGWLCLPTDRIGMSYTVYFARRGCDLDNRQKALQDVLSSGIGLIDDDQVDEIHKFRGPIDSKNPRIELEVWVIGPGGQSHKPAKTANKRLKDEGWKPITIFGEPGWEKDGEVYLEKNLAEWK